MVGPFENGPSKRSVFEWIRYSNVRYSSPDCSWNKGASIGYQAIDVFSEAAASVVKVGATLRVRGETDFDVQ